MLTDVDVTGKRERDHGEEGDGAGTSQRHRRPVDHDKTIAGAVPGELDHDGHRSAQRVRESPGEVHEVPRLERQRGPQQRPVDLRWRAVLFHHSHHHHRSVLYSRILKHPLKNILQSWYPPIPELPRRSHKESWPSDVQIQETTVNQLDWVDSSILTESVDWIRLDSSPDEKNLKQINRWFAFVCSENTIDWFPTKSNSLTMNQSPSRHQHHINTFLRALAACFYKLTLMNQRAIPADSRAENPQSKRRHGQLG